MSRSLTYCAISTTVTAAVILNAFEKRPNFYSACVYLSQSSACLMVLTNMFLCMTFMLGKALQLLFFGRLRAIETEHLYERAWYAVTETCLAMTIFRDEFDSRFFVFFTALLLLKIFHWLSADRIEYMEQTPEVAWKFHIRMGSCVSLLLLVDFWLVKVCLSNIFARGPNVMIMFAFEFTILASSALGVAGKYALNLAEARRRATEPWDNKSLYVFYLELVCDFFKLVTYLAFFATILTFYGLPLHIIRDLYVTLRSFTSKCANFMRFRRATQNMDAQYPDATVAELEATGDQTCIVCRDDMIHASAQPTGDDQPALGPLDKPKKLPCGHILHLRCLRSWLERQQSCPMCRRPVLDPAPAPTPTQAPAPPQPGARPQPPGVHAGNRLGGADAPGRNDNNVRGGAAFDSATRTRNAPQLAGDGPPAIDLPAGFQLPPGWAIIPELPNGEVRATSSGSTVTITRPGSDSHDSGDALPGLPPQSHQVNAGSSSAADDAPRMRLYSADWRPPPLIPLFDSPTLPRGVDTGAADRDGAAGAGAGSASRQRRGTHLETTLAALQNILPSMDEAALRRATTSTRRLLAEHLRALREVQNALQHGVDALQALYDLPLDVDADADGAGDADAASADTHVSNGATLGVSKESTETVAGDGRAAEGSSAKVEGKQRATGSHEAEAAPQ